MIEFDDYKVKINGLQPTLVTLGGALKLEAAKKEIAELAVSAAEKLVQESMDNTYEQFFESAKRG